MKYKTFRALVLSVSAVLVGGSAFLLLRSCGGDEPSPSAALMQRLPDAAPAAPTPRMPDTPPADTTKALPEGATPLRPMDREILAAAARNIAGDKVKDAIKGRPWKVNLYKDAGAAAVNRAKVDLDRDDKWDEKWSWTADGLERQVAPADDEQYRNTTWYHPDVGAWVGSKPGTLATAPAPAPTPTETPPAPATAGEPLRPIDEQVLAAAKRGLAGGKGKDAVPGAVKVNLYQDAGATGVNRAKLDLDRDEKWDEKWTWKDDGSVERQIAPADDEQYTRTVVLRAGQRAWEAK